MEQSSSETVTAQAVKKVPVSYGTRKFTRISHWTLFSAV